MTNIEKSNAMRCIAKSALFMALAGIALGCAATENTPYPAMAPIGQYQSASRAEEIALARSSAPASISGDAEILVLGARRYETAAAGKNGFVCIVQRSWANNFDHVEFWNPKIRGPNCFNAAAARSVLPEYLERTEWVLSGVSKDAMMSRTKAQLEAKKLKAPDVGSMCYMMSKGGYLGDETGGHWHPHLMFFLPRTAPAEWGANLPGSPVMGDSSGIEPLTVFFTTVPKWSDGTPGSIEK